VKKLLLAILFLTASAFGQGFFYQLPSPLPNARIYVCTFPATLNPCVSTASIFNDSALSVPIAVPVQVGRDGNFGFWANAGQYQVQIQAPYSLNYSITLGGGGGGGGGNLSTSGSPVNPQIAQFTDPTHVTGVSTTGSLGSVVLSGSPTLTGTALANNITMSGVDTMSTGNSSTPSLAFSGVPNGTYVGISGGNHRVTQVVISGSSVTLTLSSPINNLSYATGDTVQCSNLPSSPTNLTSLNGVNFTLTSATTTKPTATIGFTFGSGISNGTYVVAQGVCQEVGLIDVGHETMFNRYRSSTVNASAVGSIEFAARDAVIAKPSFPDDRALDTPLIRGSSLSPSSGDGLGTMTVNGAQSSGVASISINKEAGGNWIATAGDTVCIAISESDDVMSCYTVASNTTVTAGGTTTLPITPNLRVNLNGGEVVAPNVSMAQLGDGPGVEILGPLRGGITGIPWQLSTTKQSGTSVTVPAGYDASLFMGSDNALHCQLSVALGGGSCISGGGGGSSAFSAITSGTNSTAAMVVDTGASLSTTGAGTIAATSAPFSGLTASTNTSAAMLVGTGASLGPTGSGTITATAMPFSGLTSATNTTAAMLAGTGSSLAVTGTGQVGATQAWKYGGVPTAALAASASGGSLPNGNQIYVVLTYNTAAGETYPGYWTFVSTTSNSASVTVTAPNLYGYTSYNVYSCQTASNGCQSLTNYKKQAASNNCVAITTNCIIQVIGAGAAPPTTSTAYVQPPNVQTTPCAPSIIPTQFNQKTDGNFYPYAGMDFSNAVTVGLTPGVFTVCDRLIISDTKQPLQNGASQAQGGPIRNTLLSIAHQGASTAQGSTIDDRAVAIRSDDSLTTPNYEQYLGLYGEHFISNPAFTCAPAGGENCAAGIRYRSDLLVSPTATLSGMYGIVGIASSDIASPNVGSCTNAFECFVGVKGQALQGFGSTVSQTFVGGVFQGSGNAGSTAGGTIGAFILPGARNPGFNRGLMINDFGTNGVDWNIYSFGGANGANVNSGRNYLSGTTYLSQVNAVSGGVTLNGSLVNATSISTTQPGTPSFTNGQVTNVGVTGATNYQYKVVWRDKNGGTSVASATGQTSSGNATLDTNNYNRITVSTTPSYSSGQFGIIDIYRTVSGGTPSSTGKIGTITCTDIIQGGNGTNCPNFLNDQGLAGDSSTPPATDTTGSINAAGAINLTGTTTANITTTATNQNLNLVPNGTGSVVVPAGAVATPGLTFAGSTTNGLWWMGTNQIGIASSGGNNKIDFDLANNIFRVSNNVGLAWTSVNSMTTTNNVDTCLDRMGAKAMRVDGNNACNDNLGLITSGNTVRQVTSNFTTTNTTATTWLSFPAFPAVAANWSFHCNIVYQESVNTAGMVLGISHSVAPTSEQANAIIYTNSTGAASTFTTGTVTATASGSQTILTGGNVATGATSYIANIDGTIEATSTSGTLTIQAWNSSAATLTILRGSYCALTP
jgi:hypothetical protein